MAKIILKVGGTDHEIDVEEHQSIAAAARAKGIPLYGSCNGEGTCLGCSRKVLQGIGTLFNKKTQMRYEEGATVAPYVQTCKTTPLEDGAVIDADQRARF